MSLTPTTTVSDMLRGNTRASKRLGRVKRRKRLAEGALEHFDNIRGGDAQRRALNKRNLGKSAKAAVKPAAAPKAKPKPVRRPDIDRQVSPGAVRPTAPSSLAGRPGLPGSLDKPRPSGGAVSIWADLGKSIIGGIGAGIEGKIKGQNKIVAGPAVAAAAAAAGRVLPAIGRVLGSRTVAAAATGLTVGSLLTGGAGSSGCPVGHHPNKQDGVGGPKGTYCVRNRRMNVGNARAARRAVRRLKGARKLLRDIEKMMPTKTSRRRAPQHHHHPAAGG